MRPSLLLRASKILLGLLVLLPLLAQAQYPNFNFAASIASSESSEVRHVCNDRIGSTYVTGPFSDTLTIGNTIRIAPKLSSGSQHIYVAKYNSAGTPTWVRELRLAAGSTLSGSVTVQNITADSTGNVWLLGRYTGRALEVEGSPVSYPVAQSGTSDSYLVKYDAMGVLQWVKIFATLSDDLAEGLAADSRGNVFVGLSPRRYVSGYDSTMIHLYKINATGSIVNFRKDAVANMLYAPYPTQRNAITALTYDTKNDLLYVGGIIGSTQQVAGVLLTAPNRQDIFLATYTGNLDPLQAQIIPSIPPVPNPGSRLTAAIAQLAVSRRNGIVAAISFYGDVIVNGTRYVASCPATYSGVCYDALLAEFSSTGTHRWTRRMSIRGIVADLSALPNGEIVMTGSSAIDFSFGNYQFVIGASTGSSTPSSAGFVAAIDSSGMPLWLRQARGIGFQSITNDGAGNIWTGGNLAGSISLMVLLSLMRGITA